MPSPLTSITLKGSAAANATVVASLVVDTDTTGEFHWVSLQLTGTWVATVTFQYSNDNTNWKSLALTNSSGVSASTATANDIYTGPILGRYFQAITTAYTSGTVVGIGMATPYPMAVYTTSSGAVSPAAPVNVVPPFPPLAANSPTRVNSIVYENGHVLKASAGTLYSITGYNSGPAQWIQVHNAASVPADTAVPIFIFKVPSVANFSFDLGDYGDYYTIGITVCNSSTGPTKTIGAADCWFVGRIE